MQPALQQEASAGSLGLSDDLFAAQDQPAQGHPAPESEPQLSNGSGGSHGASALVTEAVDAVTAALCKQAVERIARVREVSLHCYLLLLLCHSLSCVASARQTRGCSADIMTLLRALHLAVLIQAGLLCCRPLLRT